MPYRLSQPGPDTSHVLLWPHRSLGALGFVWFIGLTAALLSMPLMAVLGSPVLWMLLPFLLAAVAGMWIALRRNDRDRSVTEELTLNRDHAALTRRNPDGSVQEWAANSHWVRVTIHPTGGPVADYLTLSGDGREVELGRFLTPDERKTLAAEIRAALSELK